MSARIPRLQSAGALVLAVAAAAAATVGLGQAYAVYGSKWTTQPVSYYVNPKNGDVSESAAEAAIRAGADAWSTQTNASFVFSYAGRTSGSSATYNGKNEVFFANESNSSLLATTYYWHSSGRMLDFDIKFWDAGYTFFTGTTGCSGGAYIEDVATHEFGHGLGLGHSSVSGATMYPTMSLCSQNWRSLEADDIAGVEYLYPPGGSSSTAPAAPSNLSAVKNSSSPTSAVNLSWTDNSTNEDNFRVERSLDGAVFTQVASVGANVKTYTDSGLQAATTYYYRVRASNAAGFSNYTNLASATTDAVTTTKPNPPSNLNASKNTSSPSSAANLSWSDNSTNEDSFRVERSLDGASFTEVASVGANTTAFTSSGLQASTTYYFRVRAANAGGFSDYTNLGTMTTDAAPAVLPGAPTAVSPRDGAKNVSVTTGLSWSATEATSFDVYFGTSSNPSLYQSNVSSTSLSLPTLNGGATYYWRVVAKNSAGSTSGSVWRFTTQAPKGKFKNMRVGTD